MDEICGFVEVNGRKVHFRRTGSGPPMLMLHPSPLSSKFMSSNMRAFASHFTCIALDNPGFGLSDPLPDRQGDMYAYADALMETIEVLGLEKPIIYGVATGASITHAFGCKYPDIAGLLMLDTFGHYDTEDTIAGYFPDVVPKRDGSHLLACWEKTLGLFSFLPWQRMQPDRRMIRALPDAGILHDMVIQQLTAGPNYKHAYRAAIVWEDKAKVHDLEAPVTLNVWPLASGIDKVRDLIDTGLPDNYTLIYSEDSPTGRYAKQLQYLIDAEFHLAKQFSASPVMDLFNGDGPNYMDTGSDQIFARFFSPNGEPENHGPLLFLHDWSGSSAADESLTAALGRERQVIAPDLPGHGDAISNTNEIEEIAAFLLEAVKQAGFEKADILAVGSTAKLGHMLKKVQPGIFGKVGYLATRPIVADAAHTAVLTAALPDLTPRHSGAHLIAAFGMAKVESLFWQPEQTIADQAIAKDNALDAEKLNRRTLDILRTRGDVAGLLQQTAKIASELPDDQSIICFAPPWQVGGSALSARLQSDHKLIHQLPRDEESWAATINAHLS